MTEALTEQERAAEIAVEQERVSLLYRELDRLRELAQSSLQGQLRAGTVGTPGARAERDAFVRLYGQRVRQLESVERRLCFGRLDLADGARRYVGRIGISDAERRDLLVDWRAPAAEPFYQATAAAPRGVIRRRQLSTSDRVVTDVQDEVLDLDAFGESGIDGQRVVVGEGALFASLDAARDGRMRDIVATIQADQDRVIRAPLDGVLVVQGGPGTGKTAVALHRTAFLLYAHRERITRTGVLLIGPNRVFLRYIEQVLPALGEAEAVVMSTPGELYPGVVATAVEDPQVAALKGDVRMAGVIAEAVARRQRLLPEPRRLVLDGTTVVLRPREVREAREHARRSGRPHNQARALFVAEILRGLVRQLARVRGTEVDAETRSELTAELRESRDVRREINWCWAPIGPERLLRDLFAKPERLAEAGAPLGPAERTLLYRERSAPWTAADVPLLDEAAELLGDDDSARIMADARAEAERRAEVEYAERVQQTFGGADFLSAEDLAGRYTHSGPLGSVAERAAADRSWAYGHVVVDEAQELSAMSWRLVARRCPSRSMTLVGDVAQTGSLAGAASWSEALHPLVGDRWRLAELSVNYRTPGLIMDVAAAVLAASGSSVEAPTSARHGRYPPGLFRLAGTAGSALVDVVREQWRLAGTGSVAVVTSRTGHADLARLLTAALPSGIVTADSDALGSPVSVLTVAAAKGLEFDSVVIVAPGQIVAESVRGANDLYVALTRPTQRLQVLLTDDEPPSAVLDAVVAGLAGS